METLQYPAFKELWILHDEEMRLWKEYLELHAANEATMKELEREIQRNAIATCRIVATILEP